MLSLSVEDPTKVKCPRGNSYTSADDNNVAFVLSSEKCFIQSRHKEIIVFAVFFCHVCVCMRARACVRACVCVSCVCVCVCECLCLRITPRNTTLYYFVKTYDIVQNMFYMFCFAVPQPLLSKSHV